VTELLSTIKTTAVRNFPATNEHNADYLDNLLGTGVATSFVPQLTAQTTNPTLGTGAILEGLYIRVFDNIFAWGRIGFGTGMTPGSGAYSLTLPVAAAPGMEVSSDSGRGSSIGIAHCRNNDSLNESQTATIQLEETTKVFFVDEHGLTLHSVWADDSPFAVGWEDGDFICFHLKYKAALL
jgi:hypothetical protein